jgi:hypothetical protein
MNECGGEDKNMGDGTDSQFERNRIRSQDPSRALDDLDLIDLFREAAERLRREEPAGRMGPPTREELDFGDVPSGLRKWLIQDPNSPRPIKREEIDAQNWDFIGTNERPTGPNQSMSMRRAEDGSLTLYTSQGRLQSQDGRTWTGADGQVAFRGTIRQENGNIIRENADNGVTTVERPDGSHSRIITTSSGERIEINTHAVSDPTSRQNRMVTVTDGSGTWVSTDNGNSYTNPETNETFDGSLTIDEYGNYESFQFPKERHLLGQSPVAERHSARVRQIEERFNVRITPPDEGHPNLPQDIRLTTRQPTMNELDALERVLARGRSRDNDGLRISFYRDDANSRRVDALGRYRSGESLIEVFGNQPASGWHGVEGVLEHELAHHEQAEATRQGGRAQADLDSTYQSMGWEGNRLRDRDGNLWTVGGTWDARTWTATINGVPTTITNAQMRERTRIYPGSTYFTTPGEMHAEAVSRFRTDRQSLMNESPEMYTIARAWDQGQIDARHGTENGRSRMIRGLDGRLVANTPENARQIRESETTWRAMTPPRVHPLRLAS